MGVVIAISSVTLIGGLLLALWALFGDRSRTPRCRRCFYEMPGANRTCPECGWSGRRESDLIRPRRRWRCLLLGVLLLAMGSVIGVQAHWMRGDGWWANAPTWLVAGAYATTNSAAARSSLANRDVRDLPRLIRRRLLAQAITPNLACVRTNDKGRARFVVPQAKARHDHWRILVSCVMHDPNLAATCAHELLSSDDSRKHALAMRLFVNHDDLANEPGLHRSDLRRLLGYAGVAGTLRPYTRFVLSAPNHRAISPTACSPDTGRLAARIAQDGTTTTRPIDTLIFLGEVQPFDRSTFEQTLAAALPDDPHAAAALACSILMQMDHTGRACLTSFLSSPSPELRYYALLALGDLGPVMADTQEQVEALMADPHPSVAATAAWTLRCLRREGEANEGPPTWSGNAPTPRGRTPVRISDGPGGP